MLGRGITKRTRDDSTESNVAVAPSSSINTSCTKNADTKYSDTSSLLSHRFSTISISSNVSSSDVSISIGGQSGGSSCYLASMSSTDFDDPRPVLASSFSLSEAEVEQLQQQQRQHQPIQHKTSTNPKVKLKTAYRKSGNNFQKNLDIILPATTEEDNNGHLNNNNNYHRYEKLFKFNHYLL